MMTFTLLVSAYSRAMTLGHRSLLSVGKNVRGWVLPLWGVSGSHWSLCLLERMLGEAGW